MLQVKKSGTFIDASKYFFLIIFALFLCSGISWGQVTASLTGTVKDASGAVIPDATVTVKHVETGLTRTTQTDAGGNYSILSLPVGEYEVTTEKSGFNQQVRRGITLVVGQQAVVNLTLEVGNVEQQVTVTGEAPIVNTTLSPTSGLVGEKEVKDLPLNGRSFDQLLTLNVGTTNYGAANTGHPAFSVAGRRPETNRFLINGVDYVGSDSSSQTVTPNSSSGQILGVDAVREFNVVQPPYGAEFGKRGGGQVNIVTTSGTNQLHGDVFEFLRNSDLDARNYFDFPLGTNIPPFKRNQFGGSLGGPLKKDKVFLFGNYEGFRQRLGLSDVQTVPDLLVRQGKLPDASGNYATPANLKPGMLRFFSLWPAPNGQELLSATGVPTGVATAFANPVEAIREDFGVTRFDYNVSTKDSLSFTFVNDDGERDTPQANIQFLARSKSVTRLMSLQETRIFSPTVLNVVTLGFSRAQTPNQTVPLIPIDPSLQFITGAGTGTITLGGVVTGGGATSITSAGADTVLLAATRNHFTWADDIHFTRGNQNISIGVWAQRVQQALNGAPAAEGGSVSYTNLAAMLADTPTQFIAVPNPTALYYRQTEAAWYVQDDVKLKPNLTLRLGLRDELTTGWNEAHGQCPNYLFDTNGIINTNPLVSPSCLIQNNAIALWQPRVGVAWDPTGTGTWAVRAGFGIYNDLQDNLAHRLNSDPPANARVSRTDPLLSFIPYPGGAQPAPSCSPTQGAPCSIFMVGGLEPTMHTPTIQQWSLTVERQLTKNLMLQLGYLGSQSYHLSASIDGNEFAPQVCQNPAGCPSGGVGAAGTAPQGVTYQPLRPAKTATNSQLPNPYVANTFSWWYENVSSYEAATVSLVGRASHGLSFKVNYSFGKILDLNSAISGSNGTNEPMTILDPSNIRLNKGVAAYNLRHQFNTNYSYELPFGNGKYWGNSASGLKETLIGGWQWNAILTLQSGFPFTPQIGSNRSGNGDTFNPDLPNVNPAFTGKVNLGVDGFKKTGRYYDPAAFLLPIPGTYGNVSRGSLIGPRLADLDTSFFKRIRINERWNLQFRAEAFNIFNHANFKSPNAVVFAGTGINPAAGSITGGSLSGSGAATATSSRQIQFALKLMF